MMADPDDLDEFTTPVGTGMQPVSHCHFCGAMGRILDEENRCVFCIDRQPKRASIELVVQKWEETEAGWGCRPDGFSVHLNSHDRKEFIDDYWARQPSYVPDEYDRPAGSPYAITGADISPQVYEDLLQSKNGVRSFDRTYPGSGGTDGWTHHPDPKKLQAQAEFEDARQDTIALRRELDPE